MEKERKKELKEQYNNRHPDKGIICWQSGNCIWAAKTNDANADYNSVSFQLKFGSFVNHEMQRLYNQNPESFTFSLAKKLDYKELSDDTSDDLEILMLEFLEEHPDAKPLKPGQKLQSKQA